MNESEAGKLGAIAAYETIHNAKMARIAIYDKNPKLCQTCLSAIEYQRRINKFCSSSCAARFNNKLTRDNKIKERKCKGCGSSYKNGPSTSRLHCADCKANKLWTKWRTTPKQTKEEYNKYQREYHKEQYRKVKRKMIGDLGGVCVVCKSTDNLEIDHIDRRLKSYDISKMWAYAPARLRDELLKCQLLCPACHDTKSIVERGFKVANNTHGTISSYRYCKCELCKTAKRNYTREYRSKQRDKTS